MLEEKVLATLRLALSVGFFFSSGLLNGFWQINFKTPLFFFRFPRIFYLSYNLRRYEESLSILTFRFSIICQTLAIRGVAFFPRLILVSPVNLRRSDEALVFIILCIFIYLWWQEVVPSFHIFYFYFLMSKSDAKWSGFLSSFSFSVFICQCLTKEGASFVPLLFRFSSVNLWR